MTNLDVIQYALILTGVGTMIYGLFWPGALLAGVGTLIAVARRLDRPNS